MPCSKELPRSRVALGGRCCRKPGCGAALPQNLCLSLIRAKMWGWGSFQTGNVPLLGGFIHGGWRGGRRGCFLQQQPLPAPPAGISFILKPPIFPSAKEAGGKQSRALTLCNTPGSIGEQFAQRSPQPRPLSPSVSPSPPQGPCGAGGEGLGPGGPQMGPGCLRVPGRARGGGGGSSGVPRSVSRSQPPPGWLEAFPRQLRTRGRGWQGGEVLRRE